MSNSSLRALTNIKYGVYYGSSGPQLTTSSRYTNMLNHHLKRIIRNNLSETLSDEDDINLVVDQISRLRNDPRLIIALATTTRIEAVPQNDNTSILSLEDTLEPKCYQTYKIEKGTALPEKKATRKRIQDLQTTKVHRKTKTAFERYLNNTHPPVTSQANRKIPYGRWLRRTSLQEFNTRYEKWLNAKPKTVTA
jgi:hypothetical protein